MNSNANMSSYPPAAAGIPNKIPTRFIVLAGEKIRAYKTSTDTVEEYKIAKDMYFTDEDVIPQPGNSTTNAEIRVALDKGDWTWMDVHYTSIRKIILHSVNPSLVDNNVERERDDFARVKNEQLTRMMEDQVRRLRQMEAKLDSSINNIQTAYIPAVAPPKAQPQTQPKDINEYKEVNKLIGSQSKRWKDLLTKLDSHLEY